VSLVKKKKNHKTIEVIMKLSIASELAAKKQKVKIDFVDLSWFMSMLLQFSFLKIYR